MIFTYPVCYVQDISDMCGDMKAFERLPGDSLLELEASLGLLGQQQQQQQPASTTTSSNSHPKGPKPTASGRRKQPQNKF